MAKLRIFVWILVANWLKSIVIDGWIFRQSLSTKIGPEVYKNSNGFSNSPDDAIVWALAFALEKAKRVASAGIAIAENAFKIRF